MDDSLPPIRPQYSDYSPNSKGSSKGSFFDPAKQVKRKASNSGSFSSLSLEEGKRPHSSSYDLKEHATEFRQNLPVRVVNAATPIKVEPATKKFSKRPPLPSLEIPVRVSREEPPSTASQEPIFAPGFLTALGVDTLHAKAVDEEFENLLRQKGMMPSYELSSSSKKQPTAAPDRLLCQHSLIASGSSGITYEMIDPDHTSFLYKVEKHPKLLTNSTNPNATFWRHGDLSPAGLNLPHLVETTSYFLNVKLPDGREGKFFVPADKMEEFAQHLPSDAEVKLEGQLMKKAPGQTLAQLLAEGAISFNPDDPDRHFYTIVTAVNEFLKAAYAHNFVHRDLKPENILYDPMSKTVTIIDTGEASHLGDRHNPAEIEPSISTKQRGTRQIMAPTMFEGKEYGSEVDFFSAGMLFLKLLHPEDVAKFNATRFSGTVRDRFFGKDPATFLPIYLDYLHSGSDDDDGATTKETSPATLQSSSSRDIASPMTGVNSTPSITPEHSLLPSSTSTSSLAATESASPATTENDNTPSSTEQILKTHPHIRKMIDLYFQASAGGSPKAQEMSSNALEELESLFASS